MHTVSPQAQSRQEIAGLAEQRDEAHGANAIPYTAYPIHTHHSNIEGTRLHPSFDDKNVRRFKASDVERLAKELEAEQRSPRNAQQAVVRAAEMSKGELAGARVRALGATSLALRDPSRQHGFAAARSCALVTRGSTRSRSGAGTTASREDRTG